MYLDKYTNHPIFFGLTNTFVSVNQFIDSSIYFYTLF
ncbi:hypothetical protein DSL99_2451 [Leeuwenhoekiella marinoflava]|uniref:Uncharacterized protein n=1 Tax=Leeuwenhoekiella marinoflava TaxID=988 RepID=A0A4Q0PKF8_9FLAO|nr:hypothetical protein DSL99_2451 [Leeuwenhoekiella marinoflava]